MCSTNCCCIFTVKTGTLILLWITTIFWGIVEISVIYEILVGLVTTSNYSSVGVSSLAFILNSAILAAAISGLFAIEKKKQTFLIPYFLYRIFCAFIICLLLLPLIFAEEYLSVEVGEIPGLMGNLGEHYVGSYADFCKRALWLVIAIQIFVIVLEIHFTTVVYKCYQEIEQEEELKKKAIPMNATWNANDKINVHLP